MFGLFGMLETIWFLIKVWIICGAALIVMAKWNGVKLNWGEVRKAFLLGPLPFILWGFLWLLNYCGLSPSALVTKLSKSLEKPKKIYEDCKNKVPSKQDAKDVYESYKNKIPAVPSFSDAVEACKNKIPSRDTVYKSCKKQMPTFVGAYESIRERLKGKKKEENNNEAEKSNKEEGK